MTNKQRLRLTLGTRFESKRVPRKGGRGHEATAYEFALPPLSLLALACWALPATAVETATPAVAVVADAPQRVEVAANIAVSERREAVGSKEVVTGADLTRYGDSTLADGLRRIPGLSVQTTPGGDVLIGMRGFGSAYTQILIDGDPVAPGVNVATIAPELIERIEVIRTPSANLGTQAIAGTINIILKRAVHGHQRSLKLSTGEHDRRPNQAASLQLADRGEKLAYAAGLSFSRDQVAGPTTQTLDGFDSTGQQNSAQVTHRDEQESTVRQDGSLDINWTPTPDDTLTLSTLLRHQLYLDHFVQQTLTLEGPLPDFSAATYRYTQLYWLGRAKGEWKHQFSDDASLSLALSAEDGHRKTSAPLEGYDETGTLVDSRYSRGGNTDRPLNAVATYTLAINDAHSLELGLADNENSRDEWRVQEEQTWAGREADNFSESYRADIRRRSAYAQDQWTLDKRLSLYGGVRWETVVTTTSGDSMESVSNRAQALSPILQMAWSPASAPQDRLRVSIAETFRTPTVKELIPRRWIMVNNSATNPDIQGNPDLRPERAWGIDLSYERAAWKSGNVAVSSFAKRIDDVIVTELVDAAGDWISQPANDGRAWVYGLELRGMLPLVESSLALPLTLRFGLTRNWSRVVNVPGPDNHIADQAPYSGNLGAGYDFGPALSVGADATWTAAVHSRIQTYEAVHRSNQRVLDAFALWHWRKGTDLRLSMSNLLHPAAVAGTDYLGDDGSQRQRSTTPSTVGFKVSLEMKL